MRIRGAPVDCLVEFRGGLWENSPIHQAVEKGYFDIVQSFLDHTSCDINQLRLFYPVRDVSMAQLLIQSGVSVNPVNEASTSPFHDAICGSDQDSRCELVRLFIENGVDVHVRDLYIGTLLNLVDLDIPTMSLLIDAGIDINSRRWEDGMTALHMAVIYLGEEEVKFLLHRGADPRITDNRGYRPLECAIFNRRWLNAKTLILH